MSPTIKASAVSFVLAWFGVVSAAPPTERVDASDFVTGTAKEFTTSAERIDNGREIIRHYLILKVDSVHRTTPDSNRTIKKGDTITIRWSPAKQDSKTFGMTHDAAEGAVIRAWLGRYCSSPDFYPIDHPRAIEIVSLSSDDD
jgi:hypothetical protein